MSGVILPEVFRRDSWKNYSRHSFVCFCSDSYWNFFGIHIEIFRELLRWFIWESMHGFFFKNKKNVYFSRNVFENLFKVRDFRYFHKKFSKICFVNSSEDYFVKISLDYFWSFPTKNFVLSSKENFNNYFEKSRNFSQTIFRKLS